MSLVAISNKVSYFVADVSELRSFLRNNFQTRDDQLDLGVGHVVWPQVSQPGQRASQAPVWNTGASDQIVSTAEVYQDVFRRIEQERFSSSLATELCPSSRSLFCYTRDHSPMMVPWLLDDGLTSTRNDQTLRRLIDTFIQRHHQSLVTQGEQQGSATYRTAMARLLLADLVLGRDEGGLGLTYRVNATNTHRRLDALEAFQAGHGDCNSFSFIFYAMAKRAGLEPNFIRISGQRNPHSGLMEEIQHVGVALRLNPSQPDQLTPTDPSYAQFLNTTQHLWYRWSNLEMMASHLRNRALYNDPGLSPSDTLDWREQQILRALEIAPNEFSLLLSASLFYTQYRQNETAAQRYARQAAVVNPSLQTIWNNP